MNSVGSHGSSSLPFMMKVMVYHFVSDFHEVMTTLNIMLPLIIVVEIFLQLHQAFPSVLCTFYSLNPRFQSLYSNVIYCQSFIVLLVVHYSLFFSLFHPHHIFVILSLFFYYRHDLNFC